MNLSFSILGREFRFGSAPAAKSSGVPAEWFARAIEGLGTTSLDKPYALSAWVRRAIKHVSGPIASVELVFNRPGTADGLRRWNGKGRRIFTRRGVLRRDEGTEVELPRIREFLRAPMRDLTYEDFVEASLGWMKLTECFWLLDERAVKPFPEVDATPFPQLIVARPDCMRHVVQDGRIVAWEYHTGKGQRYTLDPQLVVRLYGWNPYDDFRGLGDYPSASNAAETHWLGGNFRRNLMANNGDTGPFIVAKNGVPTDPQREQILRDLRAKRAAQQRGDYRPVFLTGDIEVQDPQIKAVDAAFIAGQMEDRHEIFAAFGVPPGLADVKASYSIGQASDWFALIFNTCIPEGRKFCAALEVLIERLTGERVEVGLDWDDHYIMQQVRSERMKDADGLWAKGMPMVAISEHLQLGLPRFEGDDVGYLPFSVAPVGSAGLDEPAPAPAADAALAEDDSTASAEPVQEMLRALRDRESDGGASVLASRATNKQLWESHMRRRQKSVRLYQSKVSKLFNEFRATALKHFYAAHPEAKSGGASVPASRELETRSLLDLIFDRSRFGAAIVAQLDPVARTVMNEAGQQLFSEIGKADDAWTMPPQDALRFVAGRTQPLEKVAETARAQLNTALTDALEQGLSTDQTADAIRGVFNNLSKYEARRIAITETSAAYGFSRHEAMTSAGIEYKTWLSSHGPHVRPSHAQAERDYSGAPIPVDQPFRVGGEELMYPGDPNGSPGNIINCQCIQLAAAPPEESELP